MMPPEDGAAEGASGIEPGRLSMADLLRLADAVPRLDRLVLLVTMRDGGNRGTIIFEILEGLRNHLDATAPAGGQRGEHERADAICSWFDGRIAEEEARARATRT